jgi:hypothetical protein|tara:strand:- start:363 stop:647 length:285 start_codon:yes stop_codon:yes gene_type:complete
MSKEKIEKVLEKELGEFYVSTKTSYFNDNILRFITFNMLGTEWDIIPNKILDLISKYNWRIELLEFRGKGFYMIVENRNFTLPKEKYNSIGEIQ